LTVYLNAVVVVNLVEYSNINEDALFDGLTAGTDDVFGEAPKPNVDEWSPEHRINHKSNIRRANHQRQKRGKTHH
jgi:hypothetical protein